MSFSSDSEDIDQKLEDEMPNKLEIEKGSDIRFILFFLGLPFFF